MDEDAVLDRLAARHFIGRTAGQALGGGELLRPRTARPVELFGQQHPVRPLFGDGPLNQCLGRGDVGALVVDRVHLDERDFHTFNLGGAPSRVNHA